jgi:hypothetical protein
MKYIEKDGRKLVRLRESMLFDRDQYEELDESQIEKHGIKQKLNEAVVEVKTADVVKVANKLMESIGDENKELLQQVISHLQNSGVQPKFRVWRLPVTRMDVKNANGRIYPRQLWVNVKDQQKDLWQGLCGLCDHPKDDNDPGLFRDQAVVWHDFEIPQDGKVCYGYGTFVGPYGQLAQEILDAGGRVGLSSSGFGDVDKRTRVVDPDTFQIERLADIVLNPSQSVYGSLEDTHSEPVLQSPNQTIEYSRNQAEEMSLEGRAVKESTIPQSHILKEKNMATVDAVKMTEAAPISAATSKMEEKMFRKYVETFMNDLGKFENPMARLKEAAEILDMFEDGIAPDLRESVEARVIKERDDLVVLVEKAVDVQKTLGVDLEALKENAPKIVEKAMALKDQVTDYEQLSEALTERNKELAEESKSLKKQLEEMKKGTEESANKIVEQLTKEKERLEKRLEVTRNSGARKNEALELRVASLRKRLDEAIDNVSKKDDDVDHVKEATEALKKRLHETIVDQRKAKIEVKKEAKQLEKQLERVKETRREALTEAEKTKLELSETKIELKKANKRLDSAKVRLMLKEKTASTRALALEKELVVIRSKLDENKKEIIELQRAKAKALAEARKSRKYKESLNESVSRENAKMRSDMTKVTESNAVLEKRIGLQETRLKEAAKLLQEFKAEKEKEAVLKETAVNRAVELEEKNSTTLKENVLLKNRLAETEELLVKLDEQFKAYKEAVADKANPIKHFEPKFEQRVGQHLNFREGSGQQVEAYWGDLVAKYGENVKPYERHIRGAKTLQEATYSFLKFKDYIDPRFNLVKEATLDESAIHSRNDRIKLLESVGVPVYQESKSLDEINNDFMKRSLGKGLV